MRKIILQTKEIYLRKINIDDIDNGWLEWVNDKSLCKYLLNSNGYSRDELIDYMQNSKLPDSLLFAVCRVKDDKYIGNIRLSIDKANLRAAYGILIGASNHGCKNAGTNALILIAYYGFYILNLNKIYSGIVLDNIASIKSCVKAGFQVEGIFKEFTQIDGIFYDDLRVSMLRSDFEKKGLASLIIKSDNG
jgi:RimJ/RimL family protein N-acetyltransferase